MDSFDYIVVGSGAAGTHAAYFLAGKNVLVLDAGLQPQSWPETDLEQLKKTQADIAEIVLGKKFESLHNLAHEYLSPKLKAPMTRYVTAKPPWDKSQNPMGYLQSYAQGGLANAWGGGVYRYNDIELDKFPYKSKDLKKYYDQLGELIGVQGEHDYFLDEGGKETHHLQPMPLTLASQNLLKKYRAHQESYHKKGFHVMRARLALLPHEFDNRKPYSYAGADFFSPRLQGLYSPYYTLNKLITGGQIKYAGGWIVESFKEEENSTQVYCRSFDGNNFKTFTCKKLLLGAGTLNTAKIVLRSYNDYAAKLPILENQISFLPSIGLNLIGKGYDENYKRIGGELIISSSQQDRKDKVIVSFYSLRGPLFADFWSELPLSTHGKLMAFKYLLPSMAVFQIFEPGKFSSENYLQLNEQNQLKFASANPTKNWPLIKKIAALSRSLGFMTVAQLASTPPPGSSIHYAGPLGMNSHHKYATDDNAKLKISKSVYIIDGAAFPDLPSKNLTYTIMAHAARTADLLKNGR